MATFDQLTGVFRTVFADPGLEITPQTTANDVDGWDSLSHINLMVAVERHFKLRFSQREITSFKHVGDLIAAIEAKLAAGAAGK